MKNERFHMRLKYKTFYKTFYNMIFASEYYKMSITIYYLYDCVILS